MTSQHISLHASMITELFYSESFCRRLNQAANATKRTGHEYAFSVYRSGNSADLKYSDVLGGTTDRAPSDEARRRGSRSIIHEEDHIVVDLHFHPDPLVPVPSLSDLYQVHESLLALHDCPIVAIGSARRRGYGELLLMQRAMSQPLSHSLFREIKSRLHSVEQVDNIDALSNGLRIDGYFRCDWMSFRYGRNVAYAMHERVPRLDRFAYSNGLPI